MDTLKFVFEESDIGMGQNLVLAIKIAGIYGSSSPKIVFTVYVFIQCEAPKIAKLVYNSNNYGLWYANNYSYWGL